MRIGILQIRKGIYVMGSTKRPRNFLSGADESGWAHLAPVGSNIAKQSPEFDPRNYGYGKLGELVSATKLFDMEERQVGDTNSKALYVRIKQKK